MFYCTFQHEWMVCRFGCEGVYRNKNGFQKIEMMECGHVYNMNIYILKPAVWDLFTAAITLL